MFLLFGVNKDKKTITSLILTLGRDFFTQIEKNVKGPHLTPEASLDFVAVLHKN